MGIQLIFLQSAAAGSSSISLIMMALIFGVFYFFMIRPQAKKQKQQDSFVNDISKGDEVVTNSGIIGKINRIDGNEVSLLVDTKTYIRILKTSISKELSEAYQKGPTIEKEKAKA